MADPATLMAVAGGSKIAGTALNTTAQLQSIKAQQNYLAGDTTYQSNQMKYRTAKILGEQQTMAAASGISTTSGSPMLDELDTARQAELQRQDLLAKTNFQQSLLKRQKSWTILGGLFNAVGQGSQMGYQLSQAGGGGSSGGSSGGDYGFYGPAAGSG